MAAFLPACTTQGKDPGPGDPDAAVVDPTADGGTPPAVDAAVNMRDAAPQMPTNNVRIIVEPGDGGSALLAAIQGAQRSIHMTMYLLSNTAVITALIARKNAGVEVKVVLNQNFPGGTMDNLDVYNQLHNAGVAVVYAPPGFTYTHEKCVIIDGTEAWIMTMNVTQTSARDNREYLAVDRETDDIAEAETIFAADYAHTSVTLGGKLLVAPVNARDKLIALIQTAKTSIDVEGEEFSDSRVADALAVAANSGVKVRVVVASGSAPANQLSAIATVKGRGGTVVSQSNPTIHAKALVVDGARAYVGSANFSGGSLGYNRELGLIVGTATEVAKVTAAINTDYASGTRQ